MQKEHNACQLIPHVLKGTTDPVLVHGKYSVPTTWRVKLFFDRALIWFVAMVTSSRAIFWTAEYVYDTSPGSVAPFMGGLIATILGLILVPGFTLLMFPELVNLLTKML